MKTVQRIAVPLRGYSQITWPEGSVPLSVQAAEGAGSGGIYIWFLGDNNSLPVRRTIIVVDHGESAPDESEVDYLGPVVDGSLAHHVFLKRARD